jgi:cell division protein FtsQ
MTLLTLLVLVAGGLYLHQEDTLPVLHVTVEGELKHTDRQQLQQIVKPYVTGSFIDVDVAGLRVAAQAMPWIEQIQVRRVWPDTLHLIVTEHQAIARWNGDSLVNTRGQVFSPATATFPEGLVHLHGPDGSSEMMARRLVAMQRDLNALELRIRDLRMDERRSWGMTFSNELELQLGRADSEARLQRFIRVLGGQLAVYREQIATIDMRYTNGLAVQWKDGQQPDFNGTV